MSERYMSMTGPTTSGHVEPGAGAVAFVALGSNLGDRLAHLRFAVTRLDAHPDIHVTGTSPVYASDAHTLEEGGEAPPYLNAVVRLETRRTPNELLGILLEIERDRGRDRRQAERWAPRTLDLDLLLFGTARITDATLEVPHPRMSARAFVLLPLRDLAPDLHLPLPYDADVETLLARCPDTSSIVRTRHVIEPEAPARSMGAR